MKLTMNIRLIQMRPDQVQVLLNILATMPYERVTPNECRYCEQSRARRIDCHPCCMSQSGASYILGRESVARLLNLFRTDRSRMAGTRSGTHSPTLISDLERPSPLLLHEVVNLNRSTSRVSSFSVTLLNPSLSGEDPPPATGTWLQKVSVDLVGGVVQHNVCGWDWTRGSWLTDGGGEGRVVLVAVAVM